MSARYSPKANLLAGAFLLAGVVLAVAMSFVLADVQLTRTNEYVIRFSLRDGATGLSPDAPVRVGGQQVGKVRAIRVEPDEHGEFAVHVDVTIRADIRLYEDAWAYLEVPLLGTASTINIPYLGTGERVGRHEGASPRLEPGETLVGSVAPPAFLANAGFGPEQREQVQRIFAEAERALTTLADAVEAVSPRVEPAADDAAATVAAARRAAESLETDLAGWRERVGRTIDNAHRASERLPEAVEDARTVMADAKSLMATGREILTDNRPRIDNILTRTESVVTGVEEEWMPEGRQLLAAAREGVDAYTRTGQHVEGLIAEQRPGIEKSLANLRVMTDQFKFLAIEARAQPWRLLHRPNTRELENQLLYDSARSYAVAVSDLRAASEAMEALVSRPLGADPERLQTMRIKLQEAFENYAEAEAALLDRMIRASGGASP
jgi:ABC-type transporter Mla subunit MlaD